MLNKDTLFLNIVELTQRYEGHKHYQSFAEKRVELTKAANSSHALISAILSLDPYKHFFIRHQILCLVETLPPIRRWRFYKTPAILTIFSYLRERLNAIMQQAPICPTDPRINPECILRSCQKLQKKVKNLETDELIVY